MKKKISSRLHNIISRLGGLSKRADAAGVRHFFASKQHLDPNIPDSTKHQLAKQFAEQDPVAYVQYDLHLTMPVDITKIAGIKLADKYPEAYLNKNLHRILDTDVTKRVAKYLLATKNANLYTKHGLQHYMPVSITNEISKFIPCTNYFEWGMYDDMPAETTAYKLLRKCEDREHFYGDGDCDYRHLIYLGRVHKRGISIDIPSIEKELASRLDPKNYGSLLDHASGSDYQYPEAKK